MIYDVTHRTTFRYDAPMRYARCNLRLRPTDWPGQRLSTFAVTVEPEGRVSPSRVAAYAGHIDRVVVDRPVRSLTITAAMRIAVERVAEAPREDDPGVGQVAAAARAMADLSVLSPANYLYPSPMIALSAEIGAWAGESLDGARGVVEAALDFNRRIREGFRYDGAATETDTTPAEAFARRAGVCQDFAQVMIAGLRAAGVPAAYVSGYLRTRPPAGRPRLIGADATHAWVLAWCGPERGWIGLDPTNGVAMNADHVLVAVGRDYGDIAPIDGVFVGRAGQSIEVSVDVAPVS